jgi:chitinase
LKYLNVSYIVFTYYFAGYYKKVVSLKEKNPKLKVSIAIGGPNEESWKYSDMVATPKNRKAFIGSVLVFIRYRFC